MKKAFIITVSILSCAILILTGFLVSSVSSLNATNGNLENLYQRSFYDLVNNVNNMEVEVSKLIVTNDGTSQQKSLSKIKQQTSDAENNLSLLPINMNVLEKTTRFMNQLNGYCTTLITYKDGRIEGQDLQTIENVHSSITTIKEELNSIMEKIMNGYKITSNLDNGNESADFSLSFSGLSNDTIEYPALIYDGPFADSVVKKEVKGLPKNEITRAEAEKQITKIFGEDITNLSYLGDTDGIFETYDFGVNTQDNRNYFVQITKRGGFLLTINSNAFNADNNQNNNSENVNQNDNLQQDLQNEKLEQEKKDSTKDESEVVKAESINNVTSATKKAVEKALSFANKLNLENMECVWSASSQEVCFINLAPVIDDIVMYPDVVKVKVDLTSNSVIGWEASSYAYNHIEREDLIPQLTETEAKALVSSKLQIDNVRLCVIPLDYVGETLSYEFEGKYNDYTYYLYIDAYTGKQVRVLRIVQTQSGDLVL